MKMWQKTVSIIVTFALLFNSIAPYSIAIAQELTSEPSPTPTDLATPTIAPTDSPTQSPTPTDIASPEPTAEAGTTPSISPSPQIPIEHGNLTTTVIENIDLSVVTGLNTNVDVPTVTTDKPDYSPTSVVLITGTGFTSGKTYTLEISSTDEPPVTHTDSVTADSQGTFTYAYQLDGKYRPNYKIEVKVGSERIVASVTFTDGDPPVVEIDSEPSDPTNSTSATFYFHSTEEGSAFQCKIDVSGYSVCESPKTYTGLSNGSHIFQVKATGVGGTGLPDSSNWVVNTSLQIVTVTATVSGGTLGSNEWYTSNVTVGFTCSSTSTPPEDNISNCPGDQILSTEGSSVSSSAQTANDAGGNTGTSNVVTVKTDTSNPTVSATGASASWQSSVPTIIVSASDSVSGLASVKYAWDADATGGTLISNGTDLTSTYPGNGDHTLNLSVTDNAGRTNSFSGKYMVDTGIPSAPGTPSTTTPTNSTTQTWSWTAATDSVSNIANYLYRISGDATVNSTSTGSNSTSFVTNLVQGIYSFYVKAVDSAGNTGSESSGGSLTVDTTIPTLTAAVSAGTLGTNSWYTSNVTVHFNCSDTGGSGMASCPNDEILSTESSSISSTAKASTDNAGNTSVASNVVTVKIDKTSPATPSATPVAGDYTSDQSVTLSSSDSLSGFGAIYYTTDGSVPDATKTLYAGAITVDKDMTIKAIAYDNAGNAGGILEATYGIAPVISGETSSSATTDSVTITWTTDEAATSRVIYDTASHALGAAPNYGYANSTDEDSTKVTSHSVGLTGLTAGTTYYYRTVSHGSPEAVSDENSFTTTSSDTTTGSSGGTLSDASAPNCNDTKPGSAPVLTGAFGGVNSVTLHWTEASDPVSYYLVTYGASSGAQTYGNPNVGGKGTTSYTVSGLSGGRTYFFKVRAGNGCAPGDFSNEVFAIPVGGFISSPATGFIPGVLGTETEASPGPSLSPQTLGTEDSEITEPKEVNLVTWLLTHKKISLGVILILAAIGYFISKQKKS
ncbi:MAG: endoglucanase-like protein, nonfunctional [Candidatus Woesebacteria bacterium GW2011_GWA2_40_7b]|uniref:Endoglucanase-like protein, nonfunctional n=1 Tax=Candidatus Woesebacteria bacterium GW2011_GWA2_40_7b TaxID=1618563 RepID=A0A0G0T0X9_9BACT|nr:MAG: endoglucanase-like protein, nonfunctional [Candidatus Woesebacteria bacterium GW2011_GWA2_40_7b]